METWYEKATLNVVFFRNKVGKKKMQLGYLMKYGMLRVLNKENSYKRKYTNNTFSYKKVKEA